MAIRYNDRTYRPGPASGVSDHVEQRRNIPWRQAPRSRSGLERTEALPSGCDLRSCPARRARPRAACPGFSGGLYGNGWNQPSPGLLDAANVAAGQVVPRGFYGAELVQLGQGGRDRHWPEHHEAVVPLLSAAGRQPPTGAVRARERRPGQHRRPGLGKLATALVGGRQGWWPRAACRRYQVQVAIIDSARIRSWNDGGLPAQINAYRARSGPDCQHRQGTLSQSRAWSTSCRSTTRSLSVPRAYCRSLSATSSVGVSSIS